MTKAEEMEAPADDQPKAKAKNRGKATRQEEGYRRGTQP